LYVCVVTYKNAPSTLYYKKIFIRKISYICKKISQLKSIVIV